MRTGCIFRVILVLSLILNVAAVAAYLYLDSHYDLSSKALAKVRAVFQDTEGEKHALYQRNDIYGHQMRLYSIYRKRNADIAMLGDSITYGVNWNELLDRDVANRGIGSDVTEGFINRLPNIYALNPRLCFIMGGINDIVYGISAQEIFQNYQTIIENLKENGITPVIQSTLYTSGRRNSDRINAVVKHLNELLRSYAAENDIAFIDLNSRLSPDNTLSEKYTYDGLHLNSSGYKIWSEEIDRWLKERGL